MTKRAFYCLLCSACAAGAVILLISSNNVIFAIFAAVTSVMSFGLFVANVLHKN